jgi:hypothetical protein
VPTSATPASSSRLRSATATAAAAASSSADSAAEISRLNRMPVRSGLTRSGRPTGR